MNTSRGGKGTSGGFTQRPSFYPVNTSSPVWRRRSKFRSIGSLDQVWRWQELNPLPLKQNPILLTTRPPPRQISSSDFTIISISPQLKPIFFKAKQSISHPAYVIPYNTLFPKLVSISTSRVRSNWRMDLVLAMRHLTKARMSVT